MFRHELSPFLKTVLDAVATLHHGVAVDGVDCPDPATVDLLASTLHEDADDIRGALEGLKATHCLVEHRLDLDDDDIESVGWWTVHPQCLAEPANGGGLG